MDLELEKLSISEEAEEKGWFDIIPYELRSIIIDFMETVPRCRFAMCSKKCAEEVEMSGYGIEELRIHEFSSKISIHVRSRDILRSLAFVEKKSGIININCKDWRQRYIWEKEEIGSIVDVVHKYFDYFIRNATKSLKILEISVKDFPLRNIKNLKNLEVVQFEKDLDFEFCDFEQICGTKKWFDLRIPQLCVDQFFQIKTEEIKISGLKWTTPEINMFLKRCVEGEVKETVKDVTLKFDVSMNVEEIFESLSVFAERHGPCQSEYILDIKNQPPWSDDCLSLLVDERQLNVLNILTRASKDKVQDDVEEYDEEENEGYWRWIFP